jgi:hypothetical protein
VPTDAPEDEQSREERLEIARRYRERRGRELRELAATCVEGEVVAAGEFSGVATEALAAIPGLGMLLLPIARRKSRKLGLPPDMLLALDRDTLHVLELSPSDVRRDGVEAEPSLSWPRSAVSAERTGRVFMRDRIALRVPDRQEPLTLYVSSLLTNPWSAEVVRLLGAETPEPLDLT